MKDKLNELKRSRLYSEELGIDLARGDDREYFKWFLASLLFGGRITATIAQNTYRAFERHGLLEARKILQAGWDYLVNPVMREGGYVRYDGRKSTQVLRDCQTLLEEYDGSLKRLHDEARDDQDLEARLAGFYGVGPVTVNIFLRASSLLAQGRSRAASGRARARPQERHQPGAVAAPDHRLQPRRGRPHPRAQATGAA